MLTYVLAIAIGVSSLTFYFTAFFKPEVHRQDDFLWSGVGLFYALVLWVCAPRITGAILLGQTASVLLLLWYGWQTLKLRRAIANPELAAEIESFSLLEWIQNRFDNLFSKPQLPVTTPPVSENVDNFIEEILEDEPITEVIEQKTTIQAEKTPTKSEKSGGFGKMFSGVTGVFRKSKPATVTPDDSQSVQPTDTTIPVSDDLVTEYIPTEQVSPPKTVTPESIVVEETVNPESIVVEETVTHESITVDESVTPESITTGEINNPESIVVEETVTPESITTEEINNPESITTEEINNPESITGEESVIHESITTEETVTPESIVVEETVISKSITTEEISNSEPIVVEETVISKSITTEETVTPESIVVEETVISKSITTEEISNSEPITKKEIIDIQSIPVEGEKPDSEK